MRFATRMIALAGAAGLTLSAAAQTPPAAPAVVRTVVAGTKVSGLDATPLYFKALAVTIPPGEASKVSVSDGILYQLSGSTEITIAGETKTINPGEALFIATGTAASLKAGSGAPSSALHFLLVPAAAVDKPAETAPASVKELYRTAVPIPDLKPGTYDLNLTRITFPAQMPSNPPHHRTGAALYYIVSGTGATTVAGKTTDKGPGSSIYEPDDLVHQWGNPGNEPFTFLAFNINPEGVAAVVPAAPPK
jgi:quercetin dioxygenase-like cupin family protein